MPNEAPAVLDILEMNSSELDNFEIVDIREPEEGGGQLLQSLLRREVRSMPLSSIDQMRPAIEPSKQYIFVCQYGLRSLDLVADWRARGFDNVYALAGGVEAVRRKYIA